jgi:hypothetical protein
MGKHKQKQGASPTSVKVIGVFADESAIQTLNVTNQKMGDAVSAIAQDLKKHIDNMFHLAIQLMRTQNTRLNRI